MSNHPLHLPRFIPHASSVRAICVLAGAGGLVACGSGTALPPAPAESCAIASGGGGSPPGPQTGAVRSGSFRIGWEAEPTWLGSASGDRGEGPFSPAHQRFIRLHSSPGPVWADCSGLLQPGWAKAWRSESGGASWRFEVAEPVGAVPLGEGWRQDASESAGVWSGSRSVVVRPGNGALTVELGRPWPDGLPFADPRLALKPAPDWDGGPSDPVGPVIGMDVEVSTDAGRSAAEGVVVARDGGWADARDALDSGAGMVITRDADVVRYGTGTGVYGSAPLEWDRLYVLVTPTGNLASGPAPADGQRLVGDPLTAGLSRFLSDGVRSEVRSATAPEWSRVACGFVAADARPGSGGEAPDALDAGGTADPNSAIVYLEGDEVAEDLAARLVALSVRGDEGIGAEGRRQLGALPRRARSVSERELRTLARSGTHTLVVPLPVRPLTPCEVRRTWDTLLPGSVTAVPLLESRATALVRSDLWVGLVRTWDGLVRIRPAAVRP